MDTRTKEPRFGWSGKTTILNSPTKWTIKQSYTWLSRAFYLVRGGCELLFELVKELANWTLFNFASNRYRDFESCVVDQASIFQMYVAVLLPFLELRYLIQRTKLVIKFIWICIKKVPEGWGQFNQCIPSLKIDPNDYEDEDQCHDSQVHKWCRWWQNEGPNGSESINANNALRQCATHLGCLSLDTLYWWMGIKIYQGWMSNWPIDLIFSLFYSPQEGVSTNSRAAYVLRINVGPPARQ